MNHLPEAIASKPELDTSFTSTGAKLFYHQEAMQALRDGKGTPISCWIAPTDVCNFKCSYCSVQERAGDSLKFSQITGFLDQLIPLGLKSVTLSGGGNCLVYKCKESGKNIEDVVKYAYERGLEVAMITNTVALADYRVILKDGEPVWALLKNEERETAKQEGWYIRKGWRTLSPGALDMLTWCRISLAGLDHNHLNHGVCIPDFDQTRLNTRCLKTSVQGACLPTKSISSTRLFMDGKHRHLKAASNTSISFNKLTITYAATY